MTRYVLSNWGSKTVDGVFWPCVLRDTIWTNDPERLEALIDEAQRDETTFCLLVTDREASQHISMDIRRTSEGWLESIIQR